MNEQYFCKNANRYLNFDTVDGEHKWLLSSEENRNEVRLANSIPWKLDATCNMDKNTSLCYEIEFHEKPISVCVKGNKDSKINDMGFEYLKTRSFDPEWTKKIQDAQTHFNNKQKCHQQPFIQADGTYIETWVDKDDEVTCESIVNEAVENSNDKQSILNVFESIGSQHYECVLDTGHISEQNNIMQTEMNWVRKTKYPCKDKGWSCDDNNLKHYTGGDQCNINDDCHKNVEFGVCDLNTKTCLSGNSTGKQCSQHEDCDILKSYSQGYCENNVCMKGSTLIDASYFKPLDCDESLGNVDKNGEKYNAKYQYCGEIRHGTQTKFSGYCVHPSNKDGKEIKTFKACKPFEHDVEMTEVKNKEEDFQMGNQDTYRLNYHVEDPPWKRLVICPDEHIKQVGDKIICELTMQEIPTKLPKTIIATSIESATQKCNLEYPMYKTVSKLKF